MKKTTKFLMAIAVLLTTMGMSLKAQEPVNGKAFFPIISTTDNPVCFYIESASNGSVTTGSWTNSALGQVVYPAGSGQDMNYGAIPATKDNALWVFIGDENGIKLFNKGTGFYLTGSSKAASNASNVTVKITPIESNNQFSIKSSNATSYMLAWKENKLNRWSSDQGVNSMTAWYIVLPKDLDIAKTNATNILANTVEGNLPYEFTTENRTNLQNAIGTANGVNASATEQEKETAAMVLNNAIEAYIASVNTPTLSEPTFSAPSNSNLLKGDNITITSDVANGTIKYTIDGSDPYTSTTIMEGTSPITINIPTTEETLTIRAIVRDDTDGISDEATATYNVINAELNATYYVRFQRYDGSLVLEDKGDTEVIRTAKPLNPTNLAQQWTITKGTQDGLYKLTSGNGRTIYYANDRFRSATSPTESTDLRLVVSANREYTGYEIQRNGSTTKAMNPIGGSTANKEIGEYNIGDGGNVLVFVTPKELLKEKIDIANALITASTVGEHFGQYSSENKETLQNATNTAQQIYSNTTATTNEISQQIVTLNTAIDTFKSTQQNNISLLQASKSTDYRWFTIKSTSSRPHATGKVISSNGRAIGKKFTYEELSSPISDAQLFRFELSADGNSVANIVNKAGNVYMSQKGEIVANATGNTGTFAVTPLEDGVSFKITASIGMGATLRDIHAQQAGADIVNWNDGVGSSSAWIIDFVKDESNSPTGISNTAENQFNILINDGKVSVSGVEEFEIYTISGQQVNTNQRLEKGVYIVKVNETIQKVIVK